MKSWSHRQDPAPHGRSNPSSARSARLEDRRAGRWCGAALAWVVVLGTGASALAQESKITMEVLGFNEEGDRMLVKMDDNQVGLGVRLYDVETGMPVEPWKKFPLIQYQRGDEVQTIKSAKRRYKIKVEVTEALKTQDEKLAFFGVEKGENLVLAATDYKRLGRLMVVPLKQDPETKKFAQATLKTIYWTPDFKLMVAVVSQKIKGQFLFEKDYFHSMKFKESAIAWVEPEKKPEEKKKEEEEKKDDGWWPFW